MLAGRRHGGLHVRSGGNWGPTVPLLHGLLATGDAFGAAYDALAATRQVVVPDLLGFGRSLDEDRTDFGPDQHLDALDNALQHLGLPTIPSSLGPTRWERPSPCGGPRATPQLVERIVCWGPPLYPADSTVHTALADTGPLARLFATDCRLAHRLCAWSCRHRQLAGWVTPSPPRLCRHPSLEAHRSAPGPPTGPPWTGWCWTPIGRA